VSISSSAGTASGTVPITPIGENVDSKRSLTYFEVTK